MGSSFLPALTRHTATASCKQETISAHSAKGFGPKGRIIGVVNWPHLFANDSRKTKVLNGCSTRYRRRRLSGIDSRRISFALRWLSAYLVIGELGRNAHTSDACICSTAPSALFS